MKRLFSFVNIVSIGVVLFAVYFGFAGTFFAQEAVADTFGLTSVGEQISVSSQTPDLRVTVVRIINIFLGFLGIVAVCIVLYGGYLYMTSRGDDEKIGTAKKILVNGSIGLLIVLSAFGITSFVLSRLQDSISGTSGPGGGGGGGGELLGSCDDVNSPYYAAYATTRCAQFCDNHPVQCASSQYFIVKSITPHTPDAADSTGMNNSVIRVLFSKQPAGAVSDIFKIFKKESEQEVDITSQFNFSFEEGGLLVAATYTQGPACASVNGVSVYCLSNGEYRIEVNQNLRDIEDRALTLEVANQSFPRIATFRTGLSGDTPIIDSEFSALAPISIGGYHGDDTFRAVRGETYTIEGTLGDTHGNAYVDMKVYREGSSGPSVVRYVDGPRVRATGGSSQSFDFEYTLRIDSNKFAPAVVYVVEIIAHDIDGNTATDIVKFIVVPASCTNGLLDAGETDVDQGAVCGGAQGNSCQSQSDCAYWLQCLDNANAACTGSNCSCKEVPYISSVEYMNGAPGNWITILGKNFGSSVGEVTFNYDFDSNGTIDSRVPVVLAQCQEGTVWNDSWIIVEVPQQAQFASEDEIVNPSISVVLPSGLSDSTDNDFGPQLGTFVYNTVQRPNLCSVTVDGDHSVPLEDGTSVTLHAGDTAAPQGTPVILEGKGFGMSEGEVIFHTAAANVESWSGDVINSAVPFLGEGQTSVYITSDLGERSNPVSFIVSSPANLRPPTITSIDPTSVTKGSYITITGNRFGVSGNVYFTQIEGGNCPGAGCILGGTLPQSCGNTWSVNQLITKIPDDLEFALGTYFVVVVREDGVKTAGSESITVVAGPPSPSICRIDPHRGFAPIFDESDAITIYGENFITDSAVKFWYPLGQSQDPDSWLSTQLGAGIDGGSILDLTTQEIKTTIPYDPDSGLSMSSGPVKIKNAAGLFSNAVNYTVLDCRDPGSPQISGFQCCSEGPEAGRWKHGNYACENSSREAGYVWRFSSGKMPQKFFVNELCSDSGSPSPSPSTLWSDGYNVCVNAQLTINFNLPVNRATVLDQSGNITNITISQCGGTDTAIDCSNDEQVVTSEFSGEEMGENALVFRKKDGPILSPQTWYRVGLSSAVSSLRFENELGDLVEKTENLEPTRECQINGATYAYCFDFRTGPANFQCSLVGAGIHPSDYTTTLLGVVQDSRGNKIYDINRVFNISAVRPLTYRVYGKSNLACTTINVDDKPWAWGPIDDAPATGKQMVGQVQSKGYAVAWEHFPAGSPISATIIENSEEIKAVSMLRITLGDPYAKNVWPSCNEACVNAEIGIEFNQIMDVRTFDASKLALHECSTEMCDSLIEPSVPLVITSDLQSETILRAYPATLLKKNTWYIVDLEEGVRAIGGVAEGEGTKLGSSVQPKQWKFRTKDSAQSCLADAVKISPDPFYSTYIGEAQLYRALPVGSPDSCSASGQQLNPWSYGWNWSVEDSGVAKVTNFSFKGSTKSACTIGCTPVGSDISRQLTSYPVCGNGTKESGEDCDIARPGEIPGTSCSFSCLRPGSSATCGNGIVENSSGEECDYNAPGAIQGLCTNTCTNAGSASQPDIAGNVNAPVCGGGGIGYGEDCDIDDPATKHGCSNTCVNIGTPISQAWCDGWVSYSQNPGSVSAVMRVQYAEVSMSEFTAACGSATSVCGNGIIEQGEECESTDSYCSARCLIQNACNTPYQQCARGEEGCLSDCTFAGSSIMYSTPSVCGDGIVGIGEFSSEDDDIRSCELPLATVGNTLGGNPVQVVTAVGNPSNVPTTGVVTDMETRVQAQASVGRDEATGNQISIASVAGEGEYHLQCGYDEYATKQSDGSYNNCPSNSDNTFGVASNSCCIERPARVEEYPISNAGIGAGSTPVCRNTYISVSFDQNIPAEYIQNNIQLVQGFAQGYSCSEHGGKDVTLALSSALDTNSTHTQNFWVRVWNSIKTFFAQLIQIRALAAPQPNASVPGDLVLCSGVTPFTVRPSYETNADGVITKTLVSIYPNQALESNQYVLVLLNGGEGGIRNNVGVSIKSPLGSELSDYWVFKTGAQICKIQEVVVEPASALYTVPNSSKQFVAQAISTDAVRNQKIVPIPLQYAWEWNWGPQEDAIFDIPVTANAENSITSKGVRGHTDGIVSARVTVDASQTNNQSGKTFSTIYSLDALFCQRPWPLTANPVNADDVGIDTLFVDLTYNFSMYYCADSGSPLSSFDDLPYFNQIEVITDPTQLGVIAPGDLPDALRRYLLFADKTEDAIGVQIFANPVKPDGTRQTLNEWYIGKFGDLSGVKQASIAGYDALLNDFNLYVNAYNLYDQSVYNNVYLFSIDTNASPETRQVFDQLIASLRFNINLTNHNRCLRAGASGVRESPNELAIPLISCTTDFDCRDSAGAPKTGTNGTCSNALTKFGRDVNRLQQMSLIQKKTEAQLSNTELNLSSGTYIPGYTNSKWSSWGKLGGIIGGAATDPVNQWVGCSPHDPSTCWSADLTTFRCPTFSQVYEYEYDSVTKNYEYYVPFEFINSSDDDFASQYVDLRHVNFDRWAQCRAPGSIVSPFGGQCGDGNVNIGEACDPPGRTTLYDNACPVGSYATATCNSSCQYTYGACSASAAVCGNGRIDAAEACDAGSENGTYGSRCTTQCQVATQSNGGQFCGNGILDTNAQGNYLEFCEEVNGACMHISESGQILKPEVHILLDNSSSMSGTKWASAVAGIQNIYAELSDSINFSLSIFSPVDKLNSPTTCSQVIPLSSLPATPNANTPTKSALAEIYALRTSLFGSNDSVAKKLVIITDGDPTNFDYRNQFGQITASCQGNTPSNVVSEIQKFNQANIQTFVVGFGNLSQSLKNNLNLFAQAGGTSNPDSPSSDLFFTAENSSQLVSAFSGILGCFEYSQYKQNSCSWNCQEYGDYCGDGIVQQGSGEECEPSISGVNTCSPYCKFVVTPAAVCGNSQVESGEQCDDGNISDQDGCSSLCSFESVSAACGNGIVETVNGIQEQCDLGSQNGLSCNPAYNTPCTYCSNTCTNITVDAVAYCGNGSIDQINPTTREACDYADSTIVGGTGALICSDKGTYSCTNNCLQLVNNCVTCGISTTTLTTPKISILNPLTQAGNSPYTPTIGYVDILRGSTSTNLQWLGYRKINYRSEDPNSYIDPFDPYTLLIDAAYQPVTNQGLQTNGSCNGEYVLLFNKRHISEEKTGNTNGLTHAQIVNQGFGDLFAYPVSGEGGQVVNEVILSPAVPQDQVRIVVRWKKKSSGALFTGNLYQDNATPSVISYVTNDRTKLCGDMDITPQSSNYYLPVGCLPVTPSTWIHQILNPSVTTQATQAFTLSALNRQSDRTIGFYVSSLSGPINQFKDYELWVDVYEYHAGQVPLYSVYKPTHTFSFGDAIQSTNPLARYWHVFNLTISGSNALKKFTVQTVAGANSGAIVTSECEVRKNMPNTTQCPTQ